jgi:hypothetical protein
MQFRPSAVEDMASAVQDYGSRYSLMIGIVVINSEGMRHTKAYKDTTGSIKKQLTAALMCVPSYEHPCSLCCVLFSRPEGLEPP